MRNAYVRNSVQFESSASRGGSHIKILWGVRVNLKKSIFAVGSDEHITQSIAMKIFNYCL